jgi:predicted TIM-barrel fold metal-dependent hydrolase
MIVDCHTHIWHREHWGEEIALESARARGHAVELTVEWKDHQQAMQAVDRAIVFGLRAQHVGLVVPNDYIAEYVGQHSQKLIGFASIDPNETGYLDELRRAVEDLKLRGLKLGPIYQNFHPLDERILPVYEYCQRNHLPIIIHQGTTFPRRAPLKFASPLLLEDVALAYPELVMVIAHLGHPWIAETIILIRKHPNLYADLSALHYRPWQFYNGMMLAAEYGVMEKILFGSDYPFTTPEATLKALREINNIPGRSGLPLIPNEQIEKIIERDTLGLLRLS